MSPETEHEMTAALLAVYAVDATDSVEATLVEQHLGTCPACRTELDSLREVAGALGTLNEQPPPELWDRIEQRLDTDDSPHLRAMPSLVADVGTSKTPERSVPARGVNGRSRRRTAMFATSLVAIAACLVAILLLATRLQAVDTRVSKMEAALKITPNSEVLAALQAPGSKLISLDSSTGSQVAQAVVVPGGRGYLLSSGLASLSSTQTYQLWALKNTSIVSVGVLGTHPTISAFTAQGMGSTYKLAISVETAPGAVQPTHQPIAVGNA